MTVALGYLTLLAAVVILLRWTAGRLLFAAILAGWGWGRWRHARLTTLGRRGTRLDSAVSLLAGTTFFVGPMIYLGYLAILGPHPPDVWLFALIGTVLLTLFIPSFVMGWQSLKSRAMAAGCLLFYAFQLGFVLYLHFIPLVQFEHEGKKYHCAQQVQWQLGLVPAIGIAIQTEVRHVLTTTDPTTGEQTQFTDRLEILKVRFPLLREHLRDR